MRSIQKFFTHHSVSTLDRAPFQLTGEPFLYGMALRRAGRRTRTRGGGRASTPPPPPPSRGRRRSDEGTRDVMDVYIRNVRRTIVIINHSSACVMHDIATTLRSVSFSSSFRRFYLRGRDDGRQPRVPPRRRRLSRARACALPPVARRRDPPSPRAASTRTRARTEVSPRRPSLCSDARRRRSRQSSLRAPRSRRAERASRAPSSAGAHACGSVVRTMS